MLFSRSEGAEFKVRRKPKKKPLAAHPLFVPSLVAWGGALAGGAVFVLPAYLVGQYVPAKLLDVLGSQVQLALPVIAALIGASVLYLVASAMRRAAIGAEPDREEDAVQPIDPGEELGSESLDAPLDDADFEEVADEFGDFDAYGGDDEAGFDDHDVIELDTAWVEEMNAAATQDSPEEWDDFADAPEIALADPVEPEPPAPRMVEPQPAVRAKSRSAIEKLRSVPPQELSLVEMVERLALALQQARPAGQARIEADGMPARDAALADALKTLAQFNEDGFGPKTATVADASGMGEADVSEGEMRAALAKLQSLRGAA